MTTVKYIDENKFEVDGLPYIRGFDVVSPGGRVSLIKNGISIPLGDDLGEIEVQGQDAAQASTYGTVAALSTALAEVVFNTDSSSSGGGLASPSL